MNVMHLDSDSIVRRTRIAGICLCALAMGLGWGIRGIFGGWSGAMLPGAMLGFAFAFLGGRRELLRRAPVFAMLGALGFGMGGWLGYGAIVGMTTGNDLANVGYGYACFALIGGLWGALGGGFISLGFAKRFHVIEAIAAFALFACVISFAGDVLLEWYNENFSFRMMPVEQGGKQRDDDWFTICILLGILYAYATARRNWFVFALSAITGLSMALAFVLGQYIQMTADLCFHGAPIDFWKVYEHFAGLGAGLGAGVALFMILRSKAAEKFDELQAPSFWTTLLAYVVVAIAFLMQVDNAAKYLLTDARHKFILDGFGIAADDPGPMVAVFWYEGIFGALAIFALGVLKLIGKRIDGAGVSLFAFASLCWLGSAAGIFKEHVPYRGGGSATVQITFLVMAALCSAISVATLYRHLKQPAPEELQPKELLPGLRKRTMRVSALLLIAMVLSISVCAVASVRQSPPEKYERANRKFEPSNFGLFPVDDEKPPNE
ncbi:MAG: hypothetical protein NUW37_12415 [Planctomycetes bacterium]|nr:hypothetical protein [Planctomycetota bacterium]